MTSLPLMATRGDAPPAQARPVPIRNAWVARTSVRNFSATVNDWIPYVGGTDFRVRFSQFPTGYDFSGYPSTLLGPFVMIETTDPGWYYYAISADAITAALSALVGQVVYQIVEGGYGGSYFGLTTSEPLLVVEPRIPIQ